MLGNNFSDYEDNFPRIAPFPTEVATQLSAQPDSSVPELSLIYSNNNAETYNNSAKLITLPNDYSLSYQLNSAGPTPPKSSVPELSIIFPNTDDIRHSIPNGKFHNGKLDQNDTIRSNGPSSKSIKTFAMFKEEFIRKIASGSVSSNTSKQNNSSKANLQNILEYKSENDVNKNTNVLNSSEGSRNINNSYENANSQAELDKSNQSIDQNKCNCNKSDYKVILDKVDKLSDLMNLMCVEIKEIKNEFQNLRTEIKSEIKQSVTDAIFQNFPFKNKSENFNGSTNHANKIEVENVDRNIYQRHEELLNINDICLETSNILVDIRNPKKKDVNMHAFKKSQIPQTLEALPENSALVISSNRTLVMEKLAAKYLPQNYIKDIIVNRELKYNEDFKTETQADKHINELSIASYDYMKKYNLISENEALNYNRSENQHQEDILVFDNIEKGPKFV